MRKVFRNGNSLAVTVPKTYAHQLSISAGSEVEWRKTEDSLILSTKKAAKKPTEIDPEVARLIKEISRKYPGVWQDLAKL